jgi:hypothetical protein
LVESAASWVFGKAEGAGGVALGVAVDDQGALFGCGERGTEVDGGGGLTDATFLIGDSDYAGQIRFSFAWQNVTEGKRWNQDVSRGTGKKLWISGVVSSGR